MASALFTSLASVADQYGQAKNSANEEKQARAEKIRSMDVQDAYLQLSRQAYQRAQESHQQEIARGNLLNLGDGRWWDVKKGKMADIPEASNPVDTVKELLSHYDPQTQKEVNDRLPALSEQFKGDHKGGLIKAVLKDIDDAKKRRNGPLIVDGRPVGVVRQDQSLTPASPEWSKADQDQLNEYLKSYKESEDVKNSRIKLGAQSRVEAYMKTRMYGALDATTGSLVYVNPSEMSKNPGRYAPPGLAIQAKNRQSLFQEIDTTKGFLKQALAKLPDGAFDPEARAQIAYVLKDDDPRSAWQAFKQSQVATSLSPEQIDYVTALVSMNESAMSLRSVAGMGAGSDMLRTQIQKMLPGSSTPSKQFAARQLQIFEGELNSLRTSVPNIGEPGMGGGVTQDSGTGQPPPGAKIIKWDDVK